MTTYEFAIRKIIMTNGTEIYIPLARKHSRVFKNPWNRIVLKYDRYMLEDLDWDVPLTFTQCQEHIEGYKQTLTSQKVPKIQKEEMINLDKLKL